MLFRKPTNPVGSLRKLLRIALTNSLLIRPEPFFGEEKSTHIGPLGFRTDEPTDGKIEKCSTKNALPEHESFQKG